MEETTLEPGTGTGVITKEDTRTDYRTDEGDHDRFAHYVDKSKLTEAYVVGSPVIALCGKVWVPSRDPSRFPIAPSASACSTWARRGAARNGRSAPAKRDKAEGVCQGRCHHLSSC